MVDYTEVRDVLLAAAALLEKDGGWTQGASARDKSGEPVGVDAPQAVSWDIHGALARVAESITSSAFNVAEEVLRSRLPPGGIPEWNNAPERTQAEVVMLLRETAAHAEQSADALGPDAGLVIPPGGA